jgi:hypothetical protein
MATTSGTIELYRGNTWGPFNPTLLYADGTEFTLPEGAVLLFTVKAAGDHRNDDEAALIKKNVTTLPWFLDASDTDIAPGTYRYDVKVVATNVETNSAGGLFIIKERVGVRDE